MMPRWATATAAYPGRQRSGGDQVQTVAVADARQCVVEKAIQASACGRATMQSVGQGIARMFCPTHDFAWQGTKVGLQRYQECRLGVSRARDPRAIWERYGAVMEGNTQMIEEGFRQMPLTPRSMACTVLLCRNSMLSGLVGCLQE